MFYIKTDDNIKLAVYDYNPSCTNTVFLVHGWPLSHLIYEYQIELLTENGFRVVALDLRGFGASDSPAFGYCYDRMAEDIYQVVKALQLKNFILTGFSMGGAIALRYMKNYCGYEVRKLILLAAAAPSFTRRPGYPCGVGREYADELIALARTDRPQLAENFSRQLFAGQQSKAAVQWFRDIALTASGIGTIQSAIALRDEDGREDLACVHIPTVIMHGCEDEIVSGELAYLQKQGIAGAVLYNLERSGHGIMYDRLQEFNKLFLRVICDSV